MLSSKSGKPTGKTKNTGLSAPYYLAVDRQLKSGYDTYEQAEQAALAIKRQRPRLLVTVYKAKCRRHITIEQPDVSASDGKRIRGGERGSTTQHAASPTKH